MSIFEKVIPCEFSGLEGLAESHGIRYQREVDERTVISFYDSLYDCRSGGFEVVECDSWEELSERASCALVDFVPSLFGERLLVFSDDESESSRKLGAWCLVFDKKDVLLLESIKEIVDSVLPIVWFDNYYFTDEFFSRFLFLTENVNFHIERR